MQRYKVLIVRLIVTGLTREFMNPFPNATILLIFKYPLNLEKMRKAANDLVGTHDFTSFVASGSQAKAMSDD